MNSLLKIRYTIKNFFNKYDIFVVPALKFILAFFVFLEINIHFSYFESSTFLIQSLIISSSSSFVKLGKFIYFANLLSVNNSYCIKK